MLITIAMCVICVSAWCRHVEFQILQSEVINGCDEQTSYGQQQVYVIK